MPKEQPIIKEICKNCIHWHNEQAELQYRDGIGICTGQIWSTDGKDCAEVLDRLNPQNLKGKEVEWNEFETIKPTSLRKPDISRYVLVTGEGFGCTIFFDKRNRY